MQYDAVFSGMRRKTWDVFNEENNVLLQEMSPLPSESSTISSLFSCLPLVQWYSIVCNAAWNKNDPCDDYYSVEYTSDIEQHCAEPIKEFYIPLDITTCDFSSLFDAAGVQRVAIVITAKTLFDDASCVLSHLTDIFMKDM